MATNRLRPLFILLVIIILLSACSNGVRYRSKTTSNIIGADIIRLDNVYVEPVHIGFYKKTIKLRGSGNVEVIEELTTIRSSVVYENDKIISRSGDLDKSVRIKKTEKQSKSFLLSNVNIDMKIYCNRNIHNMSYRTTKDGLLNISYANVIEGCSDLSNGDVVKYELSHNRLINNDLVSYFIDKDIITITTELITIANNLKQKNDHKFTQKAVERKSFSKKAGEKRIEFDKPQIAINSEPLPNLSFNFYTPLQRESAIAVVIGNRNYKGGIPDVDYAHNDADLIKRYVVESSGYREGNIIDLRDATQSSLISTFGSKDNPRGKLYDYVRPNESDIFIYYSGHGVPSLTNGKGYLLPVDADPQRIDLTGYPLETLYANLAQIPAKSVTVVIDACFSGSSQSGSIVKSASAISLKRVKPKAKIPNATIITAAGLSEVASWDEAAGHGLFTRYFLEGVTGKADADKYGNGDGTVTLGELKSYLNSEVTYMARRLYGRDQHPQVSGNFAKIMATNN